MNAEEATIAAIQEGIADIEFGRHRPWEEADAEFRAEHNIPQDA
jgi:predicted transcriptional regulator